MFRGTLLDVWSKMTLLGRERQIWEERRPRKLWVKVCHLYMARIELLYQFDSWRLLWRHPSKRLQGVIDYIFCQWLSWTLNSVGLWGDESKLKLLGNKGLGGLTWPGSEEASPEVQITKCKLRYQIRGAGILQLDSLSSSYADDTQWLMSFWFSWKQDPRQHGGDQDMVQILGKIDWPELGRLIESQPDKHIQGSAGPVNKPELVSKAPSFQLNIYDRDSCRRLLFIPSRQDWWKEREVEPNYSCLVLFSIMTGWDWAGRLNMSTAHIWAWAHKTESVTISVSLGSLEEFHGFTDWSLLSDHPSKAKQALSWEHANSLLCRPATKLWT